MVSNAADVAPALSPIAANIFEYLAPESLAISMAPLAASDELHIFINASELLFTVP